MKRLLEILPTIILLLFSSMASAQYAFPTFSPKALKADATTLYQQLDSVHFDLYHAHTRAQFDSVYQQVMEGISAPMNAFEFYWNCELPFFNVMKDAHSAAIFPFDLNESFSDQGGRFLPLEVEIYDGKVYVKRNLSQDSIPLYATVTAVNGLPSSQIINDLYRISNNEISDSEHRYMAYFFTRILYWLYGFDQEFVVEVVTQKGKHLSFDLKGIALSEFARSRKPDYEFYYNQYGTGILDINACEGRDQFASFCDSVFTVLRKNKTSFLVIDVRDNGGGSTFHGDTLFTYLTKSPFTQYGEVELKLSHQIDADVDSTYFVKYAAHEPRPHDNPKHYEGQTFMLANKNSFSSATLLAATFKCYEIGTLVGQETGGVEVFFDEPVLMTLPNTGLRFLASYQFRTCPCGKSTDRGVIPDFEVEWNLEDKLKGIDSEMELIRELILESVDDAD